MPDMFMKLDGIDGESKDASHSGEIDVLSVSFGMSNAGSFGMGSGGGVGKVSIQDLVFTKLVDKATPTLMLKCATGDHIDKATLTVRKAGGTALEFYTIELDKVFITSLTNGGSNGGGDGLTENVSLNFATVTINYTPQDDTGSAGTAIPFNWDLQQNQSN